MNIFLNNSDNLLTQAIQAHNEGDLEKAKGLYKETLNRNPQNDTALYLLGILFFQVKETKTAVEYIKKAITINPNAEYYKDLGEIYFEINNINNSIECFEKSLKLNPNQGEIYNSLGLAYFEIEEMQKAAYNYNKALKFFPENAEILYNTAVAYYFLNKLDEATELYKKALAINPNDPEIYYSLGNCYYFNNQNQEAYDCFNKALQLKPDYIDALFSLSMVLLKAGIFDKGWELYEFRFHKTNPVEKLIFPKPEWDGSPITDKILFVYHEQGIGDTIMFARYLPIINKMAKKVYFKPLPELEQLFKQNQLGAEIIDSNNFGNNINFDVSLPLMSIAKILNTNADNIPFKNGYLKANIERTEYFKKKFFNNNLYKIGIVWHCKNKFYRSRYRSIPDISCMLPLTNINGAIIYSLQKGEGEKQVNNTTNIINLGEEFYDFADTAAAIENLDLVITVDTSVAHLAGALGKQTWLLIEYGADWKWLSNIDFSPWYSSIKIYRQKTIDNWNEVIQRVTKDIQLLLNSKASQ